MLETIQSLKDGIHIKGQIHVQDKRLRVEGLCGGEKVVVKGRDRAGKRMMINEEGVDEKEGEHEDKDDNQNGDEGVEKEEGDFECAIAIVDAFEYYLHLLTSRCTMCTLHGSQALHVNFKETIDSIKSVMDVIYETVSSITGKGSMLMARMQERASEASFSCLISMQSCSSTCGTLSLI